MLQKLSEEKINEILEIGICEFAAHGPESARIDDIARRAEVSVGVLYKYFKNKDALLLSCLEHALLALDDAIADALDGEHSIPERAERLIRAVMRSAREKPDYHILYHELTAGGCRGFAPQLASEIEGVSARVYTAMISSAQQAGSVSKDIDPRFFAFFFDNLLMMLQFSYTCDYYQERFRIYCGADAQDDERTAQQLVSFIRAACAQDKTSTSKSTNGGDIS